jgi:rubredoxin
MVDTGGSPYIVHNVRPWRFGFVPPKKPWIRAPRPLSCPNCGADAECHITRMEPWDDGWDCRPCGWTLYDPGADEDRAIISNTGRHIKNLG